VVGLRDLHNSPAPRDLMSTIVYSAVAGDVETVIIDGKLVMRDRELLTLDESSVLENAGAETKLLLQRAGIALK